IRIDSINRRRDTLDNSLRIAARLQRDGSLWPRTLSKWNVDLRKILTKPSPAQVVIHTDNLPFDRLPARRSRNKFSKGNSLRQRIGSRQILLHEVFIDSGNMHAVGGVVRRDIATTYHLNSERIDVFRRDHARGCAESPFRIDGLAHNREPCAIT